jgi:hypothetical protein
MPNLPAIHNVPVCSRCLQPWQHPHYATCENCRRPSRSYRPSLNSDNNSPWWLRLAQIKITPFIQKWSKTCSYCGISLLSTEKNGWCCNQGRLHLPQLPSCETLLEPLLNQYQGHLSRMSRRLNNLFAFSAIGTTGHFMKFQGPANVAAEGRVYHRLIDVAVKDHSMHWFLYDEAARLERGREHSVPEPIVDAVRIFLNPYVSTLRHATNKIGDRVALLLLSCLYHRLVKRLQRLSISITYVP